jgi:hypothetical protein
MIRQLGEGKKARKDIKSGQTGSEERYPEPEILTDTEIDPADFFDPEEFGYRRHREPLRP